MDNSTKHNEPTQKILDKHKLFLAEYNACRWNITEACKNCGIDRTTYYHWLVQYPGFAEEVANSKQATIDWVEQKLFDQIKNDSPACTIFFMKCQGKKRGYIEKEEIVEAKQEVDWEKVGSAFAQVASGIATKKPEE